MAMSKVGIEAHELKARGKDWERSNNPDGWGRKLRKYRGLTEEPGAITKEGMEAAAWPRDGTTNT